MDEWINGVMDEWMKLFSNWSLGPPINFHWLMDAKVIHFE